ncbi:MAG: peptide chain release factor 1 [Fibrobacteres bacterium]|nr:peptide chain release factor 1 [Fibrobacterota bacterium]
MLSELERREKRFSELERLLVEPDTARDIKKFREVSKEHSDLKEILAVGHEYRKVKTDLDENRLLAASADDKELAELAASELPALEAREAELAETFKTLLIPKDPNDSKSAIVEIRAGTGGEEAALFAADLYRMYTRYSEEQRWKIDVMNTSPADMGGLKEVIFLVEGNGVYGRLKHENGVHRVQRVPRTEAQGRIHTSAASVIVMPEADDVEISVNMADLRFDYFRSSGPGGQNVNKTESAVRITHIPTGLVVSCQDEKSQHKNKAKGLKVLQSRLLDAEEERKIKEMSVEKKKIVGTGDRSEKIRTYNFPQNRLTDHRLTDSDKNHSLSSVIEGKMEPLIEALRRLDMAERLKSDNGAF